MPDTENKLNIELGDDWVFITPVIEDLTAGGIALPKREVKGYGTVYAAGPGKENRDGKLIPVQYVPGDVVMFDMFGANEINFEDQKFYAVRAASIYGTVS